MPRPLASLVAAIAALIDRLEQSGLPYALGGAIAYSSCRAKDLRDLERQLAVQAGRVDTRFVRHWLVEMLGADAPQVAAWDAMAGVAT